MSWEVTIVDVYDNSGESGIDNKIPKLEPEISMRYRALPSNPGECIDKFYEPEFSFAEVGALETLGFNPTNPWADIFPDRFSNPSNPSNLVTGQGTTISTYTYEIAKITPDIKVNGVVEKSNGVKFECAFNLESQAVAGIRSDAKNDGDLYKISQYIENGQPLDNEVNNRVAQVSEFHGSAGEIKYKTGDPQNPTTVHNGFGASVNNLSEIYGAGWPIAPVNPFQGWDNDYAEISWTEGYHYYETAATYTMQDQYGNTVIVPVTWVDFDIYMGARIAWTADLFDHTFPNPNYGPFEYGYSEQLSERPGFVKVELGEVWEGEGYGGDTGGRQHGPDDPRWPFVYGYGELGATMNTLRVYVPRARCVGLWKDVLNININAMWYCDPVFDDPISLPRELKVVYKGTTKTKMITPPGYFSGDYNHYYWSPTDSVATVTFNEDGTFEIY